MTYFSISEFDSPDILGSGSRMQASTLAMLDACRHNAGMPFIITSGYRSRAHNKRVGGVNGSSHTRGYAVDIRCKNAHHRFKIITAALHVGFKRIGVSGNFIHLDNDPKKPSPRIWTY